MVKRCKKLSLPEKASVPFRTLRVGSQQFDRDTLLDFSIDSLAQVDFAHAPGTQEPHQAVRAAGSYVCHRCRG
jgi:hypothetical protein